MAAHDGVRDAGGVERRHGSFETLLHHGHRLLHAVKHVEAKRHHARPSGRLPLPRRRSGSSAAGRS
jgi:hypothetical protein